MEDQSIELLQELVVVIRELSPHIWETMLRQSILSGITDLSRGIGVLMFLTLPCVWFSYKLFRNYLRLHKQEWESPWEFDQSVYSAVATIVLALVATISFFASAESLFGGLKMIMNPEYYAITMLIDMIKN